MITCFFTAISRVPWSECAIAKKTSECFPPCPCFPSSYCLFNKTSSKVKGASSRRLSRDDGVRKWTGDSWNRDPRLCGVSIKKVSSALLTSMSRHARRSFSLDMDSKINGDIVERFPTCEISCQRQQGDADLRYAPRKHVNCHFCSETGQRFIPLSNRDVLFSFKIVCCASIPTTGLIAPIWSCFLCMVVLNSACRNYFQRRRESTPWNGCSIFKVSWLLRFLVHLQGGYWSTRWKDGWRRPDTPRHSSAMFWKWWFHNF